MTDAGVLLVVFGATLWLGALVVFLTEKERLPGQYLRWSVYQEGDSGAYGRTAGVTIGIRRRSAKVPTGFVAVKSETFDDDLIAAIDVAREKALTLNVQTRSIVRSLP